MAVWIVLAALDLFELVVQLVGVLVLRLGNVGQQIEVSAVLAVPQVAVRCAGFSRGGIVECMGWRAVIAGHFPGIQPIVSFAIGVMR